MEESKSLPEIEGLEKYIFFKEKFWEKRESIFESIYNLLEKDNGDDNNNKSKASNPQKNIKDIELNDLKVIKLEKYLNNFKYYNKKDLNKFNLELIENNGHILLFYYDSKSVDKSNDNDLQNFNNNSKVNDNQKNDIKNNNFNEINSNNLNKGDKNYDDINEEFEICTNNNSDNYHNDADDSDDYDDGDDENENIPKKESSKEDDSSDSSNYYELFRIDYLCQIKINNKKEWICNSDYALFLIFYINDLKNVYHRKSSDNSESLFISNSNDIDKLVLKNQKKIKNIIEINGDLNISKYIKKINKILKHPN